MKHTLRRTGEMYKHAEGCTPVYTYDGWYEYDVNDGDTVIINNGSTSNMYVLKGIHSCKECPIRINNSHLCAICVKCKVTGMYRTVCRASVGVHPIDELLEDL